MNGDHRNAASGEADLLLWERQQRTAAQAKQAEAEQEAAAARRAVADLSKELQALRQQDQQQKPGGRRSSGNADGTATSARERVLSVEFEKQLSAERLTIESLRAQLVAMEKRVVQAEAAEATAVATAESLAVRLRAVQPSAGVDVCKLKRLQRQLGGLRAACQASANDAVAEMTLLQEWVQGRLHLVAQATEAAAAREQAAHGQERRLERAEMELAEARGALEGHAQSVGDVGTALKATRDQAAEAEAKAADVSSKLRVEKEKVKELQKKQQAERERAEAALATMAAAEAAWEKQRVELEAALKEAKEAAADARRGAAAATELAAKVEVSEQEALNELRHVQTLLEQQAAAARLEVEAAHEAAVAAAAAAAKKTNMERSRLQELLRAGRELYVSGGSRDQMDSFLKALAAFETQAAGSKATSARERRKATMGGGCSPSAGGSAAQTPRGASASPAHCANSTGGTLGCSLGCAFAVSFGCNHGGSMEGGVGSGVGIGCAGGQGATSSASIASTPRRRASYTERRWGSPRESALPHLANDGYGAGCHSGRGRRDEFRACALSASMGCAAGVDVGTAGSGGGGSRSGRGGCGGGGGGKGGTGGGGLCVAPPAESSEGCEMDGSPKESLDIYVPSSNSRPASGRILGVRARQQIGTREVSIGSRELGEWSLRELSRDGTTDACARFGRYGSGRQVS